MSVNTHLSPIKPNTSGRGRCFWLRWKAKLLLVMGLREHAHAVFEEILAIHPDDVLALNSLGYHELNNRRLPQALDFFERALVLTPSEANAHFNVGFVCEEMGRSQEAERAFKKPFRWTKKWTAPGTAWAWCWCVKDGLKNLWWPSSATPSCNP